MDLARLPLYFSYAPKNCRTDTFRRWDKIWPLLLALDQGDWQMILLGKERQRQALN